MSDSNHSTILRRMAGRDVGDVAETPVSHARALRLAMTKAANDTVGLVLTVSNIEHSEMQLDDLLTTVDGGLMLVGLERDRALVGVMALDMQFRAAIMELQTMGKLLPVVADDRAATSTDKSMCDPVLSHLLTHIPDATLGSNYEGWVDGITLGQKIESSRAAGLILNDGDYRLMQFDLDFGIADRVGKLMIALPPVPTTVEVEELPSEQVDWAAQFHASVSQAPAELEAFLHKFEMTIAQAQSFHVGQVVPLLDCTVSSVVLRSGDGKKVAQARLGQVGGKRAVRIEAAPETQMEDMGGGSIAGLPDMGGDLMGGDMGLDVGGMDLGGGIALDDGPALDLPMGDDATAFAMEGGEEPELSMDAAPAFDAPDLDLPMGDGFAGMDGDALDGLADDGPAMAPMDMNALSLED